MIKSLVQKAFGKLGYRIISIPYLNKLKTKNKDRIQRNGRFNLNSGERQTSTTIELIRRDHLVRYEKAIELLRAHFSFTNGLQGADLFCGNGYGSYLLSKELNCFILGMDASREAIHLANEYYSTSKTFFSEKVYPFDLPARTYDFITSFESIEHIKEDVSFIESLANAIKPGGLFFISVPNEKIQPLSLDGNRFHQKHYLFSEIDDIVSKKLNFKLLTWFGQSAYIFKNKKKAGMLSEDLMELKEKTEDADMFFVYQKPFASNTNS